VNWNPKLDTNKVSVAIATYNGSRYIREQIDSILNQSTPVSEIIVVDDQSRDDTWQQLESLAGSCHIPIKILRNDQNMGSTRTFARAIAVCSGDWIALADQDDFWEPHKIESLLKTAHQHHLDAVFSDAHVADETLNSLGRRLLYDSRLNVAMKRDFLAGRALNALARYNVVTGATLMFRSHYVEKILPIPRDWVHDYWIALIIASMGRLGLCPEPLIRYRQHSQNQIGSARRSLANEVKNAASKSAEGYLFEASQMIHLRDHLASKQNCPTWALQILDKKIAFLQRRQQIRNTTPPRIKLVSPIIDYLDMHLTGPRLFWLLICDMVPVARG